MFRAIRVPGFLFAAAAVLVISSADAQDAQKIQSLVSMVDYTHPPDFKKGTWVRYRVQGGSANGMAKDFHTTLLIAGEERFWGDDGFWLETWTEVAPGVNAAAASLVSYAVFQDSFPHARIQHYLRKNALPGGDEGQPMNEEVTRRSITAARVRKWLSSDEGWITDTLGPDTLATPIGTFPVVKVQMRRGTGKTEDSRDSTVYTEVRETRTEYRTSGVPITHIAREDIEYVAQRRAWRVGASQEGAPFQLIERSWLSSTVVERGLGELDSQILPPERRKSLREQFPAEFAGKRTTTRTPARTGGTTGSR